MYASPSWWQRSKNRPAIAGSLAAALFILPVSLFAARAHAEEFSVECDQVQGDGTLPYATIRVNPDKEEVVLTYSRWPDKLFKDKRKYTDGDCTTTQSVSITDTVIRFSEVGNRNCTLVAGQEPEHIYKIDRTTGRMDVVRLARALFPFFSQYRCGKTPERPRF